MERGNDLPKATRPIGGRLGQGSNPHLLALVSPRTVLPLSPVVSDQALAIHPPPGPGCDPDTQGGPAREPVVWDMVLSVSVLISMEIIAHTSKLGTNH